MPQYQKQIKTYSIRENTIIRSDSLFQFTPIEEIFYSLVFDDSYVSSMRGGDIRENAVFSIYVYQNDEFYKYTRNVLTFGDIFEGIGGVWEIIHILSFLICGKL